MGEPLTTNQAQLIGGYSPFGRSDPQLSDEQKATVLAAERKRLNPSGILVWADLFRPTGKSRKSYVGHYIERIETVWYPLNADQHRQVIDHLSNFDIPAERAAIRAVAEAAGSCWAWNGMHRAAAVAVVTRA